MAISGFIALFQGTHTIDYSSWRMDCRKGYPFVQTSSDISEFFGIFFFVEAKFGSVFSLHEHGDDICIIILEYILRYIITNGIIIISTMLYITNDS